MKLSLEQQIARRTKTNATARKRIGRKVTSIEQLHSIALQKRSVFIDGCWGLLPAVVVMNMTASRVLSAIHAGRVFFYRKPQKTLT